MRLSDIVGHSSLSALCAQIALFIALLGFVGVVAYLLLRRNRSVFDRARMLPLEHDTGLDASTEQGRAASRDRS